MNIGTLVQTMRKSSGGETQSGESERNEVRELEPADVWPPEKGTVLLDVREPDEYASGHLPGATLLPLGNICEEKAGAAIESLSTRVYVYCRSGVRSAKAVRRLQRLGYTEVYNIGGVLDWPEKLVKE